MDDLEKFCSAITDGKRGQDMVLKLVGWNANISWSIKPIFHEKLFSFLDKKERHAQTLRNQKYSGDKHYLSATFCEKRVHDNLILPAGTHLSSSWSDQAWDQSGCEGSGPTDTQSTSHIIRRTSPKWTRKTHII